MPRPEVSTWKVDETLPTLATNPESQCYDLDDGQGQWKTIRRYVNRQTSLGRDYTDETDGRNHVPNNQMVRRSTGD